MIEKLSSKILNLMKDLKLFAGLRDPSYLEDKSKELLLLEQSLESLRFFFLMKLHQLLMKTHKRKSNKLLKML